MRYTTLVTLAVILLGAISPRVGSSQTISELFRAMPDTIVPFSPDSETRQTLLERAEGEMTTPDPFGGSMTTKYVTDHALRIELGDHSAVELVLLPSRGGRKYICMIMTSLLTPAQSYLTLFTTEWQRIEGDTFFALPEAEHFLTDPRRREVKSALVERGHLNWEARVDGSSPKVLEVRITSFDDETAHALHPSMREGIRSVQMTWTGERYQVK